MSDMEDNMIDFAVTNRYKRFMDKLESEGFRPDEIRKITRIVVELMPGTGKEQIQQIMLREWAKRYGDIMK